MKASRAAWMGSIFVSAIMASTALHPVAAQVTAPGAGGKGPVASNLAFTNDQIEVDVRKVVRVADGGQVRVNLQVKNKTDSPIWAILAAPRASITDENGAVLLARRVTGMMTCDANLEDWNGNPAICESSRKERYMRLEPGIAYPFTMQFVAGPDKDDDKKVEAGPLQLVMRLQTVARERQKSDLIDITVRDLDAN